MEISLNIIPHKLTWVCAKYQPGGRVVNSDIVRNIKEYAYVPIQSEIGPIDLASTIHFCKRLEFLLEEGPTIHYCSTRLVEKSNGAYLMGAFLILAMNQTPQQAWEIFQNLPQRFLSYCDSTPGVCSHKCSILHCLQVLYKSIGLNWVKYKTFDVDKYRAIYSIDKGDITWIIPNKLAVFTSPNSDPRDSNGFRNFTPEDYAAIFRIIGIRTVIRLDGENYEPDRFTRNGVRHVDLSFKACTPSMTIIQNFMEIVENSEFAVALHCKSGLGKSPTLAGMYVMKRYDLTADEYIAWARICRPGSILGEQQDFTKHMESQCKSLRRKDDLSRKFHIKILNASNQINNVFTVGTTSDLDMRNSMKRFTKITPQIRRSNGSFSRMVITSRSNKDHHPLFLV